jgi:hypothetical protein
MNTNHEEKRRFERIFHDANTHLIPVGGSAVQCNLLDISLNGCLVSGSTGTADFRIKDKLIVDIILGEAVSIEVSAHIVFIGEEMQLGFQFDEIDIDSVTSLRRLVELNMGDSSMLERNLLSFTTQGSTNES